MVLKKESTCNKMLVLIKFIATLELENQWEFCRTIYSVRKCFDLFKVNEKVHKQTDDRTWSQCCMSFLSFVEKNGKKGEDNGYDNNLKVTRTRRDFSF